MPYGRRLKVSKSTSTTFFKVFRVHCERPETLLSLGAPFLSTAFCKGEETRRAKDWGGIAAFDDDELVSAKTLLHRCAHPSSHIPKYPNPYKDKSWFEIWRCLGRRATWEEDGEALMYMFSPFSVKVIHVDWTEEPAVLLRSVVPIERVESTQADFWKLHAAILSDMIDAA